MLSSLKTTRRRRTKGRLETTRGRNLATGARVTPVAGDRGARSRAPTKAGKVVAATRGEVAKPEVKLEETQSPSMERPRETKGRGRSRNAASLRASLTRRARKPMLRESETLDSKKSDLRRILFYLSI